MEKTKAAQKKEQLMPSAKNGWDRIEKQDEQKIFDFAKGYMDFMTLCKTEREVTSFTEKALVAAGFEAFDPKKPLKAGDRIYVNNRGKAVMAAVIGSVIYRFIIALALRANVPSECLKLISAVIVALAIAAPAIRSKAAFRRRRANAEKEGARHA